MAINEALTRIKEPEWRRGFHNLVVSDIPSWFRTMKWWVQFLWILFMTNIILSFNFIDGDPEMGLMFFTIFQGIYPVLGILMVMQGAMIGEKRSGTAAWVLSKPVSRTGFILAKLVNNTLASTLFIIVLPGIIGYIEIALIAGLEVSFLRFILGNCALWLHMMFFLTMSLLVGTLFNTRKTVLIVGISFFVIELLLQSILPPEMIISKIALPGPDISISEALMRGVPIFSIWPIIIAILGCIIFVLLAIWRFKREEF